MPVVKIIHTAIPPLEEMRPDVACGSELIFHGRVRPDENGKKIVALEYEHYAGMAEKVLDELIKDTISRFDLIDMLCIHRVGQVIAGDISVRIIVWSAHRKKGQDALAYFIDKLKTDVPIWKWAVTGNGDRFPTGNRPDTDGENR